MARATIYRAVTTSATVTKATRVLTANQRSTLANPTRAITDCAYDSQRATTSVSAAWVTPVDTASQRLITVSLPRACTVNVSSESDPTGRRGNLTTDLETAAARRVRARVPENCQTTDNYPLMKVTRQDSYPLMRVMRQDNCQLMKVTKLDNCQLMRVTRLDNCPLMKVTKVCSFQQMSRLSHQTSPSRRTRTSQRARTDQGTGMVLMVRTSLGTRTTRRKRENQKESTDAGREACSRRFQI